MAFGSTRSLGYQHLRPNEILSVFVAVGAWLIGTAEHYTTSVDRPIVQIGRWGQTSEGVVHRDQAVDAAFGRASGEVPPAVDVCTGDRTA